VCYVVQLSFYGFGPSSCSRVASPPASGNVPLKKSTSDDDAGDRDESSQDSGIGVECTTAAQTSCHPPAVFSDRTNLMDKFLSTGKLGINSRKTIFKRSLSVPLSTVSCVLGFIRSHVTYCMHDTSFRDFVAFNTCIHNGL